MSDTVSGDSQHSISEPEWEPKTTESRLHGSQKLGDTRRNTQLARERLKSHPVTYTAYRVAVGLIGGLVVTVGIIMIPLPGPGWLVVIAGLVILASEFTWAQQLAEFVKKHVHTWTTWITGQSWLVRGLVGLLTFAMVAVMAYATARSLGILQLLQR